MTELDRERLIAALALARNAIGVSEPNPRVGCILGRDDGTIVASGSTQQAGGAHAEVVALRAAHATGADVRGATAWVSLEPCAHHGRTPPCCDALIDAGIARVVLAIGDPYPAVNGAGIARLLAAGVRVEMADTDIAQQARELNIGFFSRIQRHRPWVRLKVATSLDGRTALHNGASQWITGAEARAETHAWRKRASAIVTGIGTVLSDDPRLDVRLSPTNVQPLRVVLDSSLRTPVDARILRSPGACLVIAADAEPNRAEALRRLGAEVCVIGGANGLVDLDGLMMELNRRNANEVHVEAGSRLNGALLRANLVDELLVYVAPKVLGPGRDMAQFAPLQELSAAINFQFVDTTQLGPDLCLRLRRNA